jgi:hypothetical protein
LPVRRVVIAGISNAGAYINSFCQREASPGGLGVLASLLAEVWDFDSAVARPPTDRIDPSKIFGKPIRAYYEGASLPAGAAAGSLLISAPANRWRDYVERGPADPKEIPPLPPERTNSNATSTLNGHDEPHRSPPTPPASYSSTPGSGYTHHLIRDFMFLDATAANKAASGPPPAISPMTIQQVTVRFKPLAPAAFAAEDAALAEFTRGTGKQQASNKHLLNRTSVAGSGAFSYLHNDVSFATLLYELVDLSNNLLGGDQFSPNWFGVAVPDGITDFTNVVIYFHPTPGQAGYQDGDYPSKTNGGDPNHSNWKELLGYVDRLGSQLAGAVKLASATPNQIVIVPLMRNSNVDGGQAAGAGILPRQWYYIVNDILKDLPTRLPTL